MKFPDAMHGLKMACGENPKRVYGSKSQAPMTRMGNVAGYRQAFADAQEYQRSWQKYERDLAEYDKKKSNGRGREAADEPKRDLETRDAARRARGQDPRAHSLLSRR